MHRSWCRARGGGRSWLRDGEDVGLEGVGGLSAGGRGSRSRISCRATVPQLGMKAASVRGVPLPVPSLLPAAAGILLYSLVPAAV